MDPRIVINNAQKGCIANNPPACSVRCPLDVDIRDMIHKIQAGHFSAAFRTFKMFAVMPAIVCHICDEPCRDVCFRKDLDAAISLRELERFCWRESLKTPEKSRFIRVKEDKTLVVGGSPAGMECAAWLAQHGHRVTLVDKQDEIGGRLWNMPQLPSEALQQEIASMELLKCLTIVRNKKIEDIPYSDYDAVFLAADGDFLINGAKLDKSSSPPNIFSLERVKDDSTMGMISFGKKMAQDIENFIKVGRVPESGSQEPMPYVPDYRKEQRIMPAEPYGEWNADDARYEASRCTSCVCDECQRVCPMMQHYGLSGSNLLAKTMDTLNPLLNSGKRGLYQVMSCDQCGACVSACPAGIDIREVMLAARRGLREKNDLPTAYYQYWLYDMKHADTEGSLFVQADGLCEYVYFPGCNIGASEPSDVYKSYRWLRETFTGQVALYLHCCGAPAHWAADEALHAEKIDEIREVWTEQGKPVFVLACARCVNMFREFLPEIQTVMIYELMDEFFEPAEHNGDIVSVFDPCVAKGDEETKTHVRSLLMKAGYDIEKANPDIEPFCCGFGGLMYTTSPGQFAEMGRKNASYSDRPYVTWCANCNDVLSGGGSESTHVLSLLFGNAEQHKPPDLSRRRENRMKLKEILTHEYMNLELDLSGDKQVKLIISPEVQRKMNVQLILDSDIAGVIEYAECNRAYVVRGDIRIAYHTHGELTLWVEYVPNGDGFVVSNVYYHRMKIVEG